MPAPPPLSVNHDKAKKVGILAISGIFNHSPNPYQADKKIRRADAEKYPRDNLNHRGDNFSFPPYVFFEATDIFVFLHYRQRLERCHAKDFPWCASIKRETGQNPVQSRCCVSICIAPDTESHCFVTSPCDQAGRCREQGRARRPAATTSACYAPPRRGEGGNKPPLRASARGQNSYHHQKPSERLPREGCRFGRSANRIAAARGRRYGKARRIYGKGARKFWDRPRKFCNGPCRCCDRPRFSHQPPPPP